MRGTLLVENKVTSLLTLRRRDGITVEDGGHVVVVVVHPTAVRGLTCARVHEVSSISRAEVMLDTAPSETRVVSTGRVLPMMHHDRAQPVAVLSLGLEGLRLQLQLPINTDAQ